jgi:hypothetical protein
LLFAMTTVLSLSTSADNTNDPDTMTRTPHDVPL